MLRSLQVLKMDKLICNGRVLYNDYDEFWFISDLKLYRQDKRKSTCSLCFDFSKILSNIFKVELVQRLLRRHPDHFIKFKNNYIIFGYGYIWTLSSLDFTLISIEKYYGSRPLNVANDENIIVYGAYFSNLERYPVPLFQSFDGITWSILCHTSGIRHFHSVKLIGDGRLLCTTGDENHENKLLLIDLASKKKTELLIGGQKNRFICMEGDIKRGFYLFMDTPLEENSVFHFDINTCQKTEIGRVSSSVFHSVEANNSIYFSTAVEPSQINRTNKSKIYQIEKNEIKFISEFKKDLWSMKYFQYGQIKFSRNKSSKLEVMYTPFATKKTGMTYKLSKGDLNGQ
jgi:hypothetical protein